MSHAEHLGALRALLLHRNDLRAEGFSAKQLERAARQGELVRVMPGQFVRHEEWSKLYPSDKHLIRTFCTHQGATSPPLFSCVSAAAILGLPVFRAETRRPHTLIPSKSKLRSSRRVVRHRGDWTIEETACSESLLHTDVGRTFLDIACSESFDVGVVVGDAALRRLLQTGEHISDECKASLLEHLERRLSPRGKDRARRVIQFLDGSAESPLESLFRLQLARLGFAVRTQVPVSGKAGKTYRMDLELVSFNVFLEADGQAKYTDKLMLGGQTLEEALLHEKYRENWVAGTTGKRIVRGFWPDAQSPEATAKLLRQFRVIPPVGFIGRIRPDLF